MIELIVFMELTKILYQAQVIFSVTVSTVCQVYRGAGFKVKGAGYGFPLNTQYSILNTQYSILKKKILLRSEIAYQHSEIICFPSHV